MDTFIKLIEALAKLVGALAWPTVCLIVLWWFGGAIRQFLSGVSEGSLKGFGIEASATRRIAEASITTATISKSDDSGAMASVAEVVAAEKDSKSAVAHAISRLRIDTSLTKKLLWVDDSPRNNHFERRALEALGFVVDTVVSTEDAVGMLQLQDFDVIISDMSRPPDEEAGRTLLSILRESGIEIPVVIYCSYDDPDFEQSLKAAGAFGVTHLASDLVMKVVDAVGPWKPRREFGRRLREQHKRLSHLRTSSDY